MNERYEPIDTLMSFQHQANHYKRISNAKKIINFQSIETDSRHKHHSSYLDSKFQKQRKQEIKKENQRIFKDFIHMSQKKGILEKAEFDSNNFLQCKNRKTSLVNPYKARQKHQKIMRQNLILRNKLKELKPAVGQRKQWERHQSLNKQMNKKLKNKSPFSKDAFNTQTFFRIVMERRESKNKKLGNMKEFYKTLHVGRVSQDRHHSPHTQTLCTQKQKLHSQTGRAKTHKKRRNHKKAKPKTSHSSLVANVLSKDNQEAQSIY